MQAIFRECRGDQDLWKGQKEAGQGGAAVHGLSRPTPMGLWTWGRGWGALRLLSLDNPCRTVTGRKWPGKAVTLGEVTYAGGRVRRCPRTLTAQGRRPAALPAWRR